MTTNDRAALILVVAVVVCALAGWFVLAGFLALSILLIPSGRR